MCASASSVINTPGLSIPRGSQSRLISRITSYSSSPYCRRTYGAIIRPVPCSALSDPPCPRTSSTMSSVKPRKRSSGPPPPSCSVSMKWMLPSLACPKMTLSS